jgi:uncharacterized protein (DUF983 family)
MLIALAIAALAGLTIPPLIDLVTKAHMPTQAKASIMTVLVAAAGAFTTVAYGGHGWTHYLTNILAAFVTTLASHQTLKGIGDPVQAKTGNKGIGPSQ